MIRYIDAEALKQDLIHNRSFYPAIVKSAIENAPTADVVEVRHGEWRIVDSDIGYVELECSLCRNKLLFNTDDGFSYCPNCGAKMDVERSENGK